MTACAASARSSNNHPPCRLAAHDGESDYDKTQHNKSNAWSGQELTNRIINDPIPSRDH